GLREMLGQVGRLSEMTDRRRQFVLGYGLPSFCHMPVPPAAVPVGCRVASYSRKEKEENTDADEGRQRSYCQLLIALLQLAHLLECFGGALLQGLRFQLRLGRRQGELRAAQCLLSARYRKTRIASGNDVDLGLSCRSEQIISQLGHALIAVERLLHH